MENRKNNIIKMVMIVLPLAAAFFTSYALCVNVSFDPEKGLGSLIKNEVSGVRLSGLVIFIAVTVFYYKFSCAFIRLQKPVTHVLSALFAFFMLIGHSYSKLGNWDFIFGNKKQFVVAMIVFTGYFILFDICLSLLYGGHFLKRLPFPAMNRENRLVKLVSSHYTASCFLIILICWLPFILSHLPGSVPYDGYYQINMFFGVNELTNHHPWVLTGFYGILMSIGRTLVSDNFGVFLIISTSSIIEALCYAFVCKKIRSWGTTALFNVFTLAFFSLIPIFGAYAQAVIKDSLFTAFFALFFVDYIDICVTYFKNLSLHGIRKNFSTLFIIELLVCLTRNNGIYIVILADILLPLFIVKKKDKIIAVFLLICIAVSFVVVDKPIATAVGVTPGSVKEVLSIPFQQTARYIQEYPEEITDEEKKTIDKVLSYEIISEKYNPELSDPVKNTFHTEASKQQLMDYFVVWWKMFLKHPGVYLEATFHNTFGYYYPFNNCNTMGAFQFYTKGEPVATGEFDIDYIVPEKIRNIAVSYAELWRKVPGTAQLMNPGSYTWLVLIGIGYLVYKKRWYGILALIVPFLNILVCIASPVNGLLRYAMPLIACAPVIIYWCIYYRTRKKEIV